MIPALLPGAPLPTDRIRTRQRSSSLCTYSSHIGPASMPYLSAHSFEHLYKPYTSNTSSGVSRHLHPLLSMQSPALPRHRMRRKGRRTTTLMLRMMNLKGRRCHSGSGRCGIGRRKSGRPTRRTHGCGDLPNEPAGRPVPSLQRRPARKAGQELLGWIMTIIQIQRTRLADLRPEPDLPLLQRHHLRRAEEQRTSSLRPKNSRTT